ncbi:hypothetical protein QZJ86_04715 [Methylomonas montana]|uniref:hypothetical protein n=1 Tax=Methylomonas montana TaxID=3058963 RepID=UPI00265853A7|nr:hypothetical protein [Methylomonas montana]WKJ91439.1 hypothetical protein QZJ86_04715 [Methylomonas montana]
MSVNNTKRNNIRIHAFLALCGFLVSACSQKSELDEANKKIAELQSQLELEKAKNSASSSKAQPTVELKPITTTETDIKPTIGNQWIYSQDKDKMSGGTTYRAHTLSTNTVEFNFPYSGEQHAALSLRDSPRHGKDVMFRIEKGQILCHSYEECSVLVRFDEDKPSSYSAVGPADNSTEVIFIQNYSRFVQNMTKSKTVRISTNIYQQGAPIFEFDVSGFDHKKFKSSK